jgi:hypothetical protein
MSADRMRTQLGLTNNAGDLSMVASRFFRNVTERSCADDDRHRPSPASLSPFGKQILREHQHVHTAYQGFVFGCFSLCQTKMTLAQLPAAQSPVI